MVPSRSQTAGLRLRDAALRYPSEVSIHGLDMQLATEGFALVPNLLSEAECDQVAQALVATETSGAGSRRLLQQAWCAALAHKVMSHPEVRRALPARTQAIQCTFFEKSAAKNWLVPIHQDLSIPVAGRVDHPALTGWSEKEGAVFVHPSSDVSLPRYGFRVGLCIDLFEACSAFTHVTARTLALPPIRGMLIRRLQTFRHLHACSGCFRLERLPGGPCTHWKAPPLHGARQKRSVAGDRFSAVQ